MKLHKLMLLLCKNFQAKLLFTIWRKKNCIRRYYRPSRVRVKLWNFLLKKSDFLSFNRRYVRFLVTKHYKSPKLKIIVRIHVVYCCTLKKIFVKISNKTYWKSCWGTCILNYFYPCRYFFTIEITSLIV